MTANGKDKLTVYNGVAISYDAIGNPTSDGTWTYTWTNGRQLASVSESGTTASYTYNENGLRVQKNVNGTVTNYVLHGKNVVHLTQGSNNLHFFYGADGSPAIVEFNGVSYGYVKNLQGDIIAIVNASSTKVVEYAYDAWGRLISKTGSLATTLGTLNPFRYRGYVYDEDTGLYYLRSRYYSPQQNRMLNADYIVGGNMYAYCKNAPISREDANGCDDNYATIGPGVDLFSLIYNQEVILGYVPDFLAEQDRIIDANIKYKWGAKSNKDGYDYATFIAIPLQKISTQVIGKKTEYIKCHTGIASMLENTGNHMLFIAQLSDYSLDQIPVGSLFLRPKGYNDQAIGHGATYAKCLANGSLTINHASNVHDEIIRQDLTFEELKSRYEYVAWPAGLGTYEENNFGGLLIDDDPWWD